MTAPAACIAEHCTRELRDHELAARQLLCDPCVHQIRRWLGAIPNLMIVLRRGSTQRERTSDTGGRGGTKEAPLPGRDATMNLTGPASIGDVRDIYGDQHGSRPLVGTLGDWVRIVLEERRVDGPDRWTEEALSGFLASQLGWCSQQPWAGEMRGELWNMICAGLRIAGVTIQTRAVPRPCPRCCELSLQKTDHDWYNRCSKCGNSYTDDELYADAPRQLEALEAERRAAA